MKATDGELQKILKERDERKKLLEQCYSSDKYRVSSNKNHGVNLRKCIFMRGVYWFLIQIHLGS